MSESAPNPSRRRLRFAPSVPEALEPRIALAARPDAALDSLQLLDSDQIRVTYRIDDPSLVKQSTWDLRLYRSADATLDPGDKALGQWSLSASASNTTDLTLATPFTIEPRRPYVIAAIDPTNAVDETNEANNTQAVRRHTLVVVTHGGFQGNKNQGVPPWQKQLGKELAAQGYDDVLLYNWVGESSIAGATRKQPARLVHRIEQRLADIPAGEPVDLHVIGHSQGTVINGLALERLDRDPPAALNGGVIRETLLDPHAADNGAPLKQYSTKSSPFGWLARVLVNDYQGRAQDPAPRVPDNVDEADVYYQHTYYAFAPHEEQHWLNLWGQVPVRGEATYTDVTGIGISHSGYYSVVDWYREHVLPTLGDGQAELPPNLTATLSTTSGRVTRVHPARDHLGESYEMEANRSAPQFEGQSWPGAQVRVTASPIGKSTDKPATLGTATADSNGHWTITSRDLPPGRYTVVASAVIDASAYFPRVKMTPRIRVGHLTVPRKSSG